MTVIAYKDGIIAADSAVHAGDMYFGRIKKIGKAEKTGYLYGAAGGIDEMMQFHEWMEAGNETQNDTFRMGKNQERFFVDTKGIIFCVEDSRSYWDMSCKFHAIGSGRAYAIGAMANGASAVEAVRIAIDYCQGVRGPVHTLKL